MAETKDDTPAKLIHHAERCLLTASNGIESFLSGMGMTPLPTKLVRELTETKDRIYESRWDIVERLGKLGVED